MLRILLLTCLAFSVTMPPALAVLLEMKWGKIMPDSLSLSLSAVDRGPTP